MLHLEVRRLIERAFGHLTSDQVGPRALSGERCRGARAPLEG